MFMLISLSIKKFKKLTLSEIFKELCYTYHTNKHPACVLIKLVVKSIHYYIHVYLFVF